MLVTADMDGRVVLPVLALLASCGRKEPAPPAPVPSVRAPVASAAPAVQSAPPAVSARPPPPVSVRAELDGGADPGLVLGELSDIGPAGPVTASSAGAVMVTRTDRVLVSRPEGTKPARARFPAVAAEAADFAPLGHGPSVADGHAYWVSRGRLVRRSLVGDGALEVLADDARTSSRTHTERVSNGVAVSYLGKPDDEGTCHARLWVSNGKALDLTPEGAGASSTCLTAIGKDKLLAVSIDGRSAMTPLHARTIDLSGAAPALGDDVVVWVGGPAQGFTEVVAGAAGNVAWAAVPLERDATHFGLATLRLGSTPQMDTEASFFDYPNGLDLAPAAAAELCGRLRLAFVRPTSRAPRGPAELVLSEPDTGQVVRVADARGFASVSIAPVQGGGMISYVADGRTWVRGVGCH